MRDAREKCKIFHWAKPWLSLQASDMRRSHRAKQQYDLVTAAYVLSELASDAERQQIIQELWDSTKGILVLVEPGTPSGYQYIINAREQVWGMSRRLTLSFGVTHPASDKQSMHSVRFRAHFFQLKLSGVAEATARKASA